MSEEDKSNYYFTQETEDAILEYTKLHKHDLANKDRLYEEHIEPAFDQLVDKIVYTYKFNLPNIESLKDECKIHLITILDKFDEDYGSKAFSYFSRVVFNWFCQKAKKVERKVKRESTFDDIPQHVQDRKLIVKNKYEPEREKEEFFESLLEEIDTWDKGRRGRLLGKNDIKVVKAIRILFNNTEDVQILTKKGVYFNLRQLTDLDTKQITRSLNKLRDRYERFKDDWDDGEVGMEDDVK